MANQQWAIESSFTPMVPSMKLCATMILLGVVCLNSALAQQTTDDKSDSQIHKTEIGSIVNVHQAGDLFFSGQFTPQDLRAIKDHQITRIITLRTDGEIDWNEQAAVENMGIEFIQVPFRTPESLTDDVFDSVRKLLNDQSKKTLFHCGSANRVGCVWLPFRVLDENVDLPTAILEAEKIGLNAKFLKEKAVDYITRKKAERQGNDRAPENLPIGINDSFLDPNLNVEEFLRRFEIESREIFAARKNIVAACGFQPGMKIADVGAGTGLFTKIFARLVGEDGWVYAVDVSPRLVEFVVKDSSSLDHRNVTGVLCAADGIGLPPNSVDAIFVCDTYHHFEFPQSTMASIYKALRPDGRLIVVDFERIPGLSREWIVGHVRAGKEVFRAEIQDAGFTLLEEKKIAGLKENYFLVFKK